MSRDRGLAFCADCLDALESWVLAGGGDAAGDASLPHAA